MKRLAIVIAALVSCVVMSAQDVKVKSRVELKGGKADVVGYAAQQDDGGYIVETDAGDVFYYSAAEIKKVTPLESKPAKVKEEKVKETKVKEIKVKEPKVKEPKTLSYDYSGDRSKTKGYMGIIEAGLGMDSYSYYHYYDNHSYDEIELGISLSMINGYRFSRHFYVGAGVGIDNIVTGMIIPMFLHLRAETSKKKVSPYIGLSGGLALATYGGVGPYLDASFGLRSDLKKHGSMWYGISVTGSSINEGQAMDTNITAKIKIAYSF